MEIDEEETTESLRRIMVHTEDRERAQRTNEERTGSRDEEDDEEHEVEQNGANDNAVSDASDESVEERDVPGSEREKENVSSDDWGAEEEQYWRDLLSELRRDISRNF